MTNLKRIIEIDLEVAKSIKGGDAAACNCDCLMVCSCSSNDSFNGNDSVSNRRAYASITSNHFK